MKYQIFVYGTLRRQASHHHKLHGAQWIADASVQGVVYRMDWYPAVISSNDGKSTVRGEIYTVDEKTLASLDEFEGEEYKRVLVNAHDDLGKVYQAWIWEARVVPNKPIILSGDWLQQ